MCEKEQQNRENQKNVTYTVWRDLVAQTYFNCHALATSAKILLNQNNMENRKWNINDLPYVAGGLYTYAIEEYGKVLFLLEKKLSNNENIIINYNKFTHHKPKFRRAFEKLPIECQVIHVGGFESEGFEEEGFDTDTIADFESRKAIFYSDFNNDKVKELPEVNGERLETALKKFIDIIETDLENFNKTFKIN